MRSTSEYSGTRIKSCAMIRPRNQTRIRFVIEAVLSNQPTAAAPAISTVAANASRCSGPAP